MQDDLRDGQNPAYLSAERAWAAELPDDALGAAAAQACTSAAELPACGGAAERACGEAAQAWAAELPVCGDAAERACGGDDRVR